MKIFCARFWRCFYCCRCGSNLPVFFARQKQTKLKAKYIFCCSAASYCELTRNNCELSVLSRVNWNWRIERLCKDPWITLRANRKRRRHERAGQRVSQREKETISSGKRNKPHQHYYHLSLNLFALLLLLLLLWSYCCCCGGATAAAAAASVVGLLWAAADNDVW